MNPCLICNKPTMSFRSLTMLTAPPASSRDAVAICEDCNEHWSFALYQNVRADLSADTGIQPLSIDRPPIPRKK